MNNNTIVYVWTNLLSIFYVFWKSQIFIHFHQMSWTITSGQILTFLTTRSISIQNYDLYQDHHICDRGHRFLIKTIKCWITYTISTEVAKLQTLIRLFRGKTTYLIILSRISWITILLCMYAPIFIHFLRFLEKSDFHPFSSKSLDYNIRPNFDFFNDPIDFDSKLRFLSRSSPFWSWT